MSDKLKLPTRTVNQFNEVRGEYRDVQVEDRPYRILENQWMELKGTYEDVREYLTDMEILVAGGLDVFFDDDGERLDVNWPWTGTDQRKPKKAAKKKVKKKAKKKASK